MSEWRFDVSGMTPAQLKQIIEPLRKEADRMAVNQYGQLHYEEMAFLRDVVRRLERALPENRPLPQGTVL